MPSASKRKELGKSLTQIPFLTYLQDGKIQRKRWWYLGTWTMPSKHWGVSKTFQYGAGHCGSHTRATRDNRREVILRSRRGPTQTDQRLRLSSDEHPATFRQQLETGAKRLPHAEGFGTRRQTLQKRCAWRWAMQTTKTRSRSPRYCPFVFRLC